MDSQSSLTYTNSLIFDRPAVDYRTARYYRTLSAKLYRLYVAVAFMGLITVSLGMDVL